MIAIPSLLLSTSPPHLQLSNLFLPIHVVRVRQLYFAHAVLWFDTATIPGRLRMCMLSSQKILGRDSSS